MKHGRKWFFVLLTLGMLIGTISSAYAVEYSLWVAGTRVTSDNAEDVLSNDPVNKGKVSYNSVSKTLTLNGFNKTVEAVGEQPAVIYSESMDNLTIKLINENTAVNTSTANMTRAVYSKGSLTIQGSGSLTAKGGNRSICSETGAVTVESGTVTVSGGDFGITSQGNGNKIEIKNGVVNVTANQIGLQAENVTIENGTVSVISTAPDEKGVAISAKDSVMFNGGNVVADGYVGVRAKNVMFNGGNVVADGFAGVIGEEDVIINAATVKVNGEMYGIYGSNIKISNGKVISSGIVQGIIGSVKNDIPGIGWTDVAGTEGKKDIAINSVGQVLADYRKVQFPAAPDPDPTAAPTSAPTSAPTVAPTAPPTSAPTPTYKPIPKTGDSANPALWLALIFLGLIGTAGTILLKARKDN